FLVIAPQGLPAYLPYPACEGHLLTHHLKLSSRKKTPELRLDRRSHGWPRCQGQNWFRGHCSSTDTCCAVAGSCRPRASSSITSMLSGRVFGFIQMKTTLRESSRLLKGPLKMLTGS
ncbi:hypothetical protein EGM_07534, partial [Macaca fascicularis]